MPGSEGTRADGSRMARSLTRREMLVPGRGGDGRRGAGAVIAACAAPRPHAHRRRQRGGGGTGRGVSGTAVRQPRRSRSRGSCRRSSSTSSTARRSRRTRPSGRSRPRRRSPSRQSEHHGQAPGHPVGRVGAAPDGRPDPGSAARPHVPADPGRRQQGLVEPVDDYMPDDLGDIVPAATDGDDARTAGCFGVPWIGNPAVLVFNKTLVDEKGALDLLPDGGHAARPLLAAVHRAHEEGQWRRDLRRRRRGRPLVGGHRLGARRLDAAVGRQGLGHAGRGEVRPPRGRQRPQGGRGLLAARQGRAARARARRSGRTWTSSGIATSCCRAATGPPSTPSSTRPSRPDAAAKFELVLHAVPPRRGRRSRASTTTTTGRWSCARRTPPSAMPPRQFAKWLARDVEAAVGHRRQRLLPDRSRRGRGGQRRDVRAASPQYQWVLNHALKIPAIPKNVSGPQSNARQHQEVGQDRGRQAVLRDMGVDRPRPAPARRTR